MNHDKTIAELMADLAPGSGSLEDLQKQTLTPINELVSEASRILEETKKEAKA